MTKETFQTLAAAVGSFGLLVFFLQWLSWMLLRFRRLRPPLWQVITRSTQRVGAGLLIVGIVTWFVARPDGTILAQVALLGGLINVLISTMYLVIYRAIVRAEAARDRSGKPRD